MVSLLCGYSVHTKAATIRSHPCGSQKRDHWRRGRRDCFILPIWRGVFRRVAYDMNGIRKRITASVVYKSPLLMSVYYAGNQVVIGIWVLRQQIRVQPWICILIGATTMCHQYATTKSISDVVRASMCYMSLGRRPPIIPNDRT